MLPDALVAHALPGRLRLRIPARRGHAEYFDAVAAWLDQLPWVTFRRVNPETGGILIHTCEEFDPHSFAQAARDAGLFEVAEGQSLAAAEPAGDAIGELLRSDLAARALLGLLLALSVIQISRGQVMAPAASLLWYAFDVAGGLKRSQGSPASFS